MDSWGACVGRISPCPFQVSVLAVLAIGWTLAFARGRSPAIRCTSTRIHRRGAPLTGLEISPKFHVHGGQPPHVENRSQQACAGRAARAARVAAAGMARRESLTWRSQELRAPRDGRPAPPRIRDDLLGRREEVRVPISRHLQARAANLLESMPNCWSFPAVSAVATNRAPWRESRSQCRR